MWSVFNSVTTPTPGQLSLRGHVEDHTSRAQKMDTSLSTNYDVSVKFESVDKCVCLYETSNILFNVPKVLYTLTYPFKIVWRSNL